MATAAASAVFVDTNILTRATLVQAPLHAQARTALDSLSASGAELWISSQVIREYMANATREQSYSRPIPMDQVLEQIQRFRNRFRVAEETTAVLDQLLDLAATVPLRGKQIHDVNIVATMLTYRISRLLTHNTADFKQFSTRIHVIALDAAP